NRDDSRALLRPYRWGLAPFVGASQALRTEAGTAADSGAGPSATTPSLPVYISIPATNADTLLRGGGSVKRPIRQSTRKPVIGVMGPSKAGTRELADAKSLGELIARQGWVVLTGGRASGVMDAASEGAKSVPGSLTIGILPDGKVGVSRH